MAKSIGSSVNGSSLPTSFVMLVTIYVALSIYNNVNGANMFIMWMYLQNITCSFFEYISLPASTVFLNIMFFIYNVHNLL